MDTKESGQYYDELEPDYDIDDEDDVIPPPRPLATSHDVSVTMESGHESASSRDALLEDILANESQEDIGAIGGHMVSRSRTTGTLQTSIDGLSSDYDSAHSIDHDFSSPRHVPAPQYGRRMARDSSDHHVSGKDTHLAPPKWETGKHRNTSTGHLSDSSLSPTSPQGRKKSAIELEMENHMADDPEFGASLDAMIRQQQVRKSFRGKRGKSQRWSKRSSGRSVSSDGSRRGSFLDLYREGATPSTKGEIKDNIHLQKEIISNIREQPWRMKRKLRTLKLAKSYVERYEGRLSKSRGYQEASARFWRKLKRMMVNFVSFLIPWEMRIKKIESHFGSVVSSYFTFLRWLLWVNIILSVITFCFIVIPEIIVGKPHGSTPEKTVPEHELESALNLMTIIDFEGYLKHSVLFYGFYGDEKTIGHGYRLPLAFFLAGLSTYAISFIVILRRMAKNSRLGRMASKDEQYTFSWRVFTSWDFMTGTFEMAKNKSAEIATNFRESILEEQEKKRNENKKLLILLRILANFMVLAVQASSSYAIYIVVVRSKDFEEKVKAGEDVSWYERNEVSIVMSLITALFPSIFDVISLMEKYHPRINLRWQLTRILVLYLLNLYTLMFALYNKIQDEQPLIEPWSYNVSKLCNTSYVIHQSEYIAETGTPDWLDNVTMATGDEYIPTVIIEDDNCTETRTVPPVGHQEISCWETMIGQEIMKLTLFDTVIAVGVIIVIDFIRGVWIRYLNPCWCWDMEKKFPEYGEFKIAENILHLIYNQATIWMGTFFSPVLPTINLLKLLILLYVRSWAVLMCNIPHERVFKASKSNNFYFALLLLMLFLVTLPVMYLMVMVRPSSECGPFRGLEKSYHVFTKTIENEFPPWLNTVFDYIVSPGVILPVFLLMVMVIFYLISLSRSYKDVNRDLLMQLHYERTEEKRKIYAMADARAKAAANADSRKDKNSTKPKSQNQSPSHDLDQRSGVRTPGSEVTRYQKGNLRVVRVPQLSHEQAAAIKARSPNVHIITSREARMRGLMPPSESPAHHSDRSTPGGSSSLAGQGTRDSPPIAVVHGKQLPDRRSTEHMALPRGSKEHLLS